MPSFAVMPLPPRATAPMANMSCDLAKRQAQTRSAKVWTRDWPASRQSSSASVITNLLHRTASVA
jgi:hypothetical protein